MATSFEPPRAADVDLRRLAAAFVDPRQDRRQKRGYLRHFAGSRRVLDVGCGDGAFLDLLAGQGVEALGLDASSAAVAACAARGHRAIAGDAATLLRRLAEEREVFDGVFLSHLVEHLPAEGVVELLRGCARVLAPAGRLVVVTPNARNLIVIGELFWLDPTHRRPYPRALLERLGAAVSLRAVHSYDDPATVPRRSLPMRWLCWLRSLCSGADRSSPLDSVVVFARA